MWVKERQVALPKLDGCKISTMLKDDAEIRSRQRSCIWSRTRANSTFVTLTQPEAVANLGSTIWRRHWLSQRGKGVYHLDTHPKDFSLDGS